MSLEMFKVLNDLSKADTALSSVRPDDLRGAFQPQLLYYLVIIF